MTLVSGRMEFYKLNRDPAGCCVLVLSSSVCFPASLAWWPLLITSSPSADVPFEPGNPTLSQEPRDSNLPLKDTGNYRGH